MLNKQSKRESFGLVIVTTCILGCFWHFLENSTNTQFHVFQLKVTYKHQSSHSTLGVEG